MRMIIECYKCESKVDAKPLAEHYSYDPEDYPEHFFAVFLECPICKNPLLGGNSFFDSRNESDLQRLWPKPETYVDFRIPEISKLSLIEAKLCFKVKAYSATAVMCGRALEGICSHHQTSAKTLAAGLKELKEKNIIDERLFLWSEELRKHRNIGAHASTEKVSREDALDLIDFVTAICDYVFVLNERFDTFMRRKKPATPASIIIPPPNKT
jgi:hypothetical protein